MPNGKFLYKPRNRLEHPYKLIIVDEVSMLPLDMWNLLLKHPVYIIACGDPFQLPPVSKDQDNHILDNPHIFLDEVMRQAKESDIINVSMDIREGKRVLPFKGNDIQIFKRKDLVDGMCFWADQILVSTNNKRHTLNYYMRKSFNRGMEPEKDDKIICLQNCWDYLSEKGNPLINGTIGYIESMSLEDVSYLVNGKRITVPVLNTLIKLDNNDMIYDIPIDYTALTTGKKFFSPEQEYAIKRKVFNGPDLPVEFNYGYAITCHKAQGSEWDKILVIEERFPFDRTEHARWLYTAVTRAAEKLTLVLKN